MCLGGAKIEGKQTFAMNVLNEFRCSLLSVNLCGSHLRSNLFNEWAFTVKYGMNRRQTLPDLF